MADKSPGDAVSSSKSRTNGWDVALAFVNGIFRLADRNRLWPLVAILGFVVLGVAVWHFPQDKLPDLFDKILRAFIDWQLAGWVFGFIAVAAFGLLYLRMRRRLDQAAARNAELEEKLMGGNRPSSSGREKKR
ncbi:MAG: hypothetical protein ABSE73_20055 [Planctomycetota bacterium]